MSNKENKGPKRFSPSDRGVRAKKHLGQHFLKDEVVAEKIANTLNLDGYSKVLEIGPGTGVLTKYLLEKDIELVAMDVDRDSISYLEANYPDNGILEKTRCRAG